MKRGYQMKRIGAACVLTLGLVGCTTPKEMKSVETVEVEEVKSIDESPLSHQDVTGTTITDVPAGTERIADAVVAQITLQYEDGSTGHLSKDTILTETMIGGIGLVAMTVPDRENPFGVFIYDREGEWGQRGMQRFGMPQSSTAVAHGLDFPVKEMNVIHSDYSSADWPVMLWTLYDEKRLISIISTDDFSEVEGEMSDQPKRYLLKQLYGNGLYYLSQGRLIIVTGNISEEELLTLTDSLPAPSSASFPFVDSK